MRVKVEVNIPDGLIDWFAVAFGTLLVIGVLVFGFVFIMNRIFN